MNVLRLAIAVATLASGGAVAAAQTADLKPPPAVSQVKLMMVTFVVSDLDRASAFYARGLGLTIGPRIEHPTVIEVSVAFPGGGPGINLVRQKATTNAAGQPHGPGRAILAVPDVSALKARLEGAGYSLRGPIMDVAQFHVRVAHVEDPDGNDLELVQLPG
ncbi:MAG TPA: VOC family protein [Sphingobium sp.]